jgi:hypothetical protein
MDELKDKGKRVMENIGEKRVDMIQKWEEKSRDFIDAFLLLFGREGRLVSHYITTLGTKTVLKVKIAATLVVFSLLAVIVLLLCQGTEYAHIVCCESLFPFLLQLFLCIIYYILTSYSVYKRSEINDLFSHIVLLGR